MEYVMDIVKHIVRQRPGAQQWEHIFTFQGWSYREVTKSEAATDEQERRALRALVHMLDRAEQRMPDRP